MKKFFITALLSMFVLLGVCACTTTPTESADPTDAPETPSPTPTLKEDLTVADFTIVYPKKTIFTSAEPEKYSRTLWNAIKEASSAFIGVSDDELDEKNGIVESTYEILIGSTNRDESAAAVTKHLKYYDYVIKYIDTKLVINAGSDEALETAVNYFIENYVNTNIASTVDGWKEIMKLDYEYIYNSNIGTLKIDGVDITEFTICSTIESEKIDKFISQVLTKAGEKLTCPATITNHEHEIIIGDCGKPEYDKAVEGLSGNDYVIDVIDGDLVIASASEAGLTHAIYAFYSQFLSQECETLNITSDIKYEYKRTYPIMSMILCGYDIKDYVIVANPNSMSTANRLGEEIAEMTGITLEVVTDSPDNYKAAIVLSATGDATSARLTSTLATDKLIVKSEGSKIYIGTNSISYGDSPAVNAFITEILGYDMNCGTAASKNVDVAEIDLTADIETYRDKFTIMQYYGIRKSFLVNEDGSINTWRIDENVEAGINVIDISGLSREATQKVLEYCDQRGDVKCIVYDGLVSNVCNRIRTDGEFLDNWDEYVRRAVESYSGYSSLYGYGITDEPTPNESVFKKIRDICTLFEELDPARMQYVNQLPYNTFYHPNIYEDFLRITDVKLISYDKYVFNDANGKENAPIYEYYRNLAMAREAALKYDAEFMNIALLLKHGFKEELIYRDISEAELSWQAYASLAYGVSAFSYFTYWTPASVGTDGWWNDEEGGAISVDGEKTKHYYDLQNVNKELQIVGDVLVDRKTTAVFHTVPKTIIIKDSPEDEEYVVGPEFTGYGTIEEIISPAVTVGFFEDDFMLLANEDFDNAIDVELKTTSKLLILNNETGEWSELDENSLAIKAGGAALIKIIK